MTITYLDSRRIQGLSTDTVQTPTYSTDFSSSTGWTTSSTSSLEITNNELQVKNTYSSNRIYYDLGSGGVSDTAWVLRFKATWSGTASTNDPFFALSLSSANTNTLTVASDHIGASWYFDRNNTWQRHYMMFGDNISGDNTSTNYSTWDKNTSYYVELIRDGSTFTFKKYSDSTYSNLLETKTGTVSTSTITGLRYIVISHYNQGSGITGIIDDLKFWNGITSVNSKPTTPIPLTSCKAYYNFEQTTGNLTNIATTANGFPDGLNSSVDGTPYNGVTQNATGKIGSYAWQFDGSDDYATIPITSSNLDFNSSSWSIGFWVYPISKNSQHEPLIQKGSPTVNNSYDWRIYWGSSSDYRVWTDNNTTNIDTTSSYGLSLNSWNHIVLTKSGSSNATVKLYLNGIERGSGTWASVSNNFNEIILMKANIGAAGQAYQDGKLDEIMLFSRVLSADEVLRLYNSGSGKSLQGQTNIETNSLFEETDTARIWWYDGTYWNAQPKLDDDFSSYTSQTSADNAWITDDSTNLRVNITNDYLYFIGKNLNLKSIYYDLGAGNVSDTAWVLRAKLAQVALNTGGVGDHRFQFGISDSNASTHNTARDYIGIHFGDAGWDNITAEGHDAQSFESLGSYSSFTTKNTLRDYYVEIKRTSSTSITVNLFSDSGYTTLIEGKTVTIPSTITGLRYLGLWFKASNTSYNMEGYIDDVKFWNGISSVKQ